MISDIILSLSGTVFFFLAMNAKNDIEEVGFVICGVACALVLIVLHL